MKTEFDRLSGKFERVAADYESAAREMLRIARDPNATADQFREASEKSGALADRLRDLRGTMTLVAELSTETNNIPIRSSIPPQTAEQSDQIKLPQATDTGPEQPGLTANV